MEVRVNHKGDFSQAASHVEATALMQRFGLEDYAAATLQKDMLQETLRKTVRAHREDPAVLATKWAGVISSAGELIDESFAEMVLHLTSTIDPAEKEPEAISTGLAFLEANKNKDSWMKAICVLAAKSIGTAGKLRNNNTQKDFGEKQKANDDQKLNELQVIFK